MTATERHLLAAVAAHDLVGAAHDLPARPLNAAGWSSLVQRAQSERLHGVLAAAVASGALPTTDEQAEVAVELHEAAMATALRLDRRLLEVARVLATAGVGLRVLKGAAVAHLDHADPSLRSYGDVDILVEAHTFTAAVDALSAVGRGRDLPERRAGFDRRFTKEATTYLADGTEVDVHRTLALGPFGLRVDLAELWADAEAFSVGGVAMAALDRERRFIHACFNAILGDPAPRLVALRDVAVMALAPTLDHDRSIDLATRWRGDAVVATAVRAASAELGVRLGTVGAWAADHRARTGDRLLLRAYRSQGGSNTLVLLSGTASAPGLSGRAAYLRALVLPSATYREARRARGRQDEWRNGARELLHRTGRR